MGLKNIRGSNERAHLDTRGLIQQPLEEGAAAADGQQGGHPQGEQLSIERIGQGIEIEGRNRLGELLRGKREATDYARMSIDQSSSVLCKLGEPDNRFEKY